MPSKTMPKKEKQAGQGCPNCGAPVDIGDVIQCTVCNWQDTIGGPVSPLVERKEE